MGVALSLSLPYPFVWLGVASRVPVVTGPTAFDCAEWRSEDSGDFTLGILAVTG